ncbi:sulfatase-like hydrolase/transferase [Candidatus Latescibacterota bacterium]
MNRREILQSTMKGLGAAAIGPRAVAAQKGRSTHAGNRPNILQIMADQQIWDSIANRSVCRTPNINRLIDQGMLFNRSYTPCPLCCPARAMLLSGAYHWHNGVFNQIHSSPSVRRDMYPDVVTYSQRLRDAGYRLGYVGKWHASFTRTPYDFGYHEVGAPNAYNSKLLENIQYYDERVKGESGGYELDAKSLKKSMQRVVPVRQFAWPGSEPFTMWGYMEGEEENTNLHGTFETAINMLGRFSRQEAPWLLEVHTIEPHDPYMPLKSYLDHYDPRSIEVPKSFYDTFEGKPGMHRREADSWAPVTEDDYRESRAHYYAYCEMVDTQVGRLLDELDRTGQANNTMVVFTSDHGDMVGAHRMWIKGWQPYEECHRIPLAIRWPDRINPGSLSDNLVQTQDLAYTYMDATGAGKLPFEDGRSLTPLFDQPARSDWPDHILGAFYGGEFLYTQRIVFTERYKYVFNGFDMDECYNLESDPDELQNHIENPGYTRIVDDLRARLYELMTQYEDPFGDHRQNRISIGHPPNRYCSPRYLPKGKRM